MSIIPKKKLKTPIATKEQKRIDKPSVHSNRVKELVDLIYLTYNQANNGHITKEAAHEKIRSLVESYGEIDAIEFGSWVDPNSKYSLYKQYQMYKEHTGR